MFWTNPTFLQNAICHKARDCPEGGKSKGKGGKSKGSPGMLWIVGEIVCILFERTNAWMKMLITVASAKMLSVARHRDSDQIVLD